MLHPGAGTHISIFAWKMLYSHTFEGSAGCPNTTPDGARVVESIKRVCSELAPNAGVESEE